MPATKDTPSTGTVGLLHGGRFIYSREAKAWINPFLIESIDESNPSQQVIRMRSGYVYGLERERLNIKIARDQGTVPEQREHP